MADERDIEAVRAELKKVNEMLAGAQSLLEKKVPNLLSKAQKKELISRPWIQWANYLQLHPDDIKALEEGLEGLKSILALIRSKLVEAGIPAEDEDLRQSYIKREMSANDVVGMERKKTMQLFKGPQMN